MTLGAVRSELAAVVRAAAPALTVYSFDHPSPHLPAAVVSWLDPISLRGGTADGGKRFTLVVRFVVGAADPLHSGNGLDALVSGPVRAAIDSHTGVAWSLAVAASIGAPEPGPNETVAVTVDVDITAII